MFNPTSHNLKITAFIGSVLDGEEITFKQRLIGVLSRLDETEWKLLEQKFLEIIGKQ